MSGSPSQPLVAGAEVTSVLPAALFVPPGAASTHGLGPLAKELSMRGPGHLLPASARSRRAVAHPDRGDGDRH